MPRNPTTGVFTRTSNSFSNPVDGTEIDPADADLLFDDYDSAFTNSIPKEPTVVTGSSAAIVAGTAAIAIQRTAPATTTLTLPTVASQDGIPLRIVDWSASVTAHTITLTPNGAETIMKLSSWGISSNAAQLASLTLYPSTVLSGWYIAP